MGAAAAKQCFEQFICQNKVVPIKLQQSPKSEEKTPVKEPEEEKINVPTLGEVIDYDHVSSNQTLQPPPTQRIAWDEPAQAVSKLLPTCCSNLTPNNEQPAKDGNPSSDESKSGWTLENLDATEVVSAISSSVPFLLSPGTNQENKPQ